MKIFIIGNKNIDKLGIAKEIIKMNDTLSIANKFITDKAYDTIDNDSYVKYVNAADVNLAFKNNALLYITTVNYISHGVTLDSFYNSDIFVMDFIDFNGITDKIFETNEILVVWLDDKVTAYNNSADKKQDLQECKYVLDRLENTPYLYFLNEKPEKISCIVNDYLNADEEEKAEILEENS